MKGRLLKNLIQEVPEELSVCEFECRKSACTARDCAECTMYQQASHGRNCTTRRSTRMKDQDPGIKWQPIWLYEVMPFIYLLAGFAVFYNYDSFIGYSIAGLLLITALLVWAMRIKYRIMNALSPDKSRFLNRPHR